MWWLLLTACGGTADAPAPEPDARTEAERMAGCLSNRALPAVRADCETWLLAHPREAVPALSREVEAMGHTAEGAMRMLAVLDHPAAVETLWVALAEDDELLSHPAAQALAKLSSPHAGPALVAALDGGTFTRRAALDALGTRADPSACDAVAALLEHDDAPTAYRAARTAEVLGCGPTAP